MKNVHLLPTNKPSRLIYNDANQLCYHSNKSYKNDRKWMHRKKFNIYITSDEQAKEGDWCLDIFTKSVFKYGKGLAKGQTTLLNATKKIILTTDQDLIKDGVQPIDDEFLNWFVKNPSCEFVETQCSGRNCIEDFGCTKEGCNGVEPLEIIIPQEELKQEPTLEEAAEKSTQLWFQNNDFTKELFIKGANWQAERMYSEEEVKLISFSAMDYKQDRIINYTEKVKWFEQFKKK
jgi:hypothetical protein